MTNINNMLNRAVQLHQAGSLLEARGLYEQVIGMAPEHAHALNLLGVTYWQAGEHQKGLPFIEKAVAIQPDFTEAISNLGALLKILKRYDEAAACYQKIVALTPGSADGYNNLGIVQKELGRYEQAVASYQQALSIRPNYLEAHNNLGNVQRLLRRYEDAVASYRNALAISPERAEVHNNLGIALLGLKRYEEAAASYQKALSIKPNYVDAYNNLGNAQRSMKRYEVALASYRNALAISGGDASIYTNLALVLGELNRHEEAADFCRKALEINPDFAEAYLTLGMTLSKLKRYGDAVACYEKALSIKPDSDFALGGYLHNKMHICDWKNIGQIFQELLNGVDAGRAVSYPLVVLRMPSSPAQQKRCAEIYMREKFPECVPPLAAPPVHPQGKIRLGYFSADFHDHPVAQMTAEMFERHDRSRFEVFGFSYAPSPDDAMRQRLSAAFDHFIDVASQSDQEIVDLARSSGIDIAIDLTGNTTNTRIGIFSKRLAPVQVGYLGYPGTMGASFIDYLIADPVLIPVGDRQHYSEKIAYLPDTYMVSGSHRQIAERQFTRGEVGLPGEGFVFCCFNNNFKITPAVFDIWMQLLQQVEGSILWLTEGNSLVMRNLQSEAKKRGIAPERLIFARRMDALSDHLARYRLADIFLDTFYYNAHVTASDALWAGLPVVTCLGNTFAGRVAASLLSAIGLTELIAHSPEEYKALALELATNPGKLALIKRQLEDNRVTHPLFNAQRFTRHIEDAYIQMQARYRKALAPDHIQARRMDE